MKVTSIREKLNKACDGHLEDILKDNVFKLELTPAGMIGSHLMTFDCLNDLANIHSHCSYFRILILPKRKDFLGNDSFFTTDTPCYRYVYEDNSPYGTGLGTNNNIYYISITPNIMVLMADPRLLQEKAPGSNINVLDCNELFDQNLFNSINQIIVIHCNRFVYSKNQNFSLVRLVMKEKAASTKND